MATSVTVISCDGQGQDWTLSEEGTPSCPVCGLTAQELGIRVRSTAKGISPKTIPGHEIEVEGTELRFLLMNGTSDFMIHTPSCPQLKRDLGKSAYDRPQILVARDRYDAIAQLWDDQVSETEDRPEDIYAPSPERDAFLDTHGFTAATEFHRCVAKVPGFAKTQKSAASGTVKRDAKRVLATLMVEAMASRIQEILDTNIADTDPETADARAILAGIGNEEIWRTVSHWIHHFPADRARWTASGMPAPDRSDWRGEAHETQEQEEENAA
jgi:hypothetical protein